MVLAILVASIGVSTFLYVSRWLFAKKWINIAQDPNFNSKLLNGKTVIITGGNAGLGKSAALDLAKRGSVEIIIACRNVDQGKQTVKSISESTGNVNVKFMLLDLASLDSVRNFVNNFLLNHDKLDCLVCNAGVWVPMDKRLKTEDGYEIHFGVNHLGHYLLVNLLSKALLKVIDSRVVIVSSGLMSSGVVDIDNIDIFNGRKPDLADKNRPSYAPTGYCDSKLMNGLVVKELANRYKNITCV